MIKRFTLFSVAAIAALILGAATQYSPHAARADVSTLGWDVQFCDVFPAPPADTAAGCVTAGGASTANGANPTYVSRLALQTAGGAPSEPFFDLATAVWSPNNVSAPHAAAPVLAAPPIGGIVGQIKFSLDSNIAVPQVSAVTGAPTSYCGAGAPVTPPAANTLASAVTPKTNPTMTAVGFDFTKYVQSFDDDNNNLVEYTAGVDPGDGGDDFPQTQADNRNTAGALAADGLPDGADLMPDFVPRLLNAAGIASVFTSRGYAIANVAPTNHIDVNFLGLDLTSIGGAYVSITTIGVVDPASTYNPATAAQTILTCTPFTSDTTTYGVSYDNPASGAVEAPTAIRLLDNTQPGGGTVDYSLGTSTAEDYDLDGNSAGLDYCPTDAATNADPDLDHVAGACDPVPGSPDNCGLGACATGANPVLCITGAGPFAAGAGVVGFEGGAASTAYPWTLDQDIDCDGAANFADNCPTVWNGSNTTPPQPILGAQHDSDSDGVGDACDPAPALGNARCGVPIPANALPCGFVTGPGAGGNTDHDTLCDDPVTIGGPGEGNSAPAFTDMTCFAPGPGFASPDSSDDGTEDRNAAAPNGVGGVGVRDNNSDSDFDGVSDSEETDGDGVCDGNPLNGDTNSNGTLDGAELSGGILCWKVDVTANANASLNPNGGGSPDSDNDGCANSEENTSGRDALWPYDFTDVPGPATLTGTDGKLYFSPSATRSKSISLADASVAISYVGRTNVNAGAAYYNGDWNNDGVPDGRQIDRGAAGGGHLANAGNNAVTLADVSVVLGQISLPGNNCVSPP